MRAVVPIRLSDAEREQIASAAVRLGLTLSGFIRQAALQASAVVERKAAVKPRAARREAPGVPEGSRPEVILVDPESTRHMVDGEYVDR